MARLLVAQKLLDWVELVLEELGLAAELVLRA